MPDKMSHKAFCRRASAAYGATPDCKTIALCGISYPALFLSGREYGFIEYGHEDTLQEIPDCISGKRYGDVHLYCFSSKNAINVLYCKW